MFGNKVSTGMAGEIQRAKLKDKTVRHFDENLNETKGIDAVTKQEASI